MNSKITFLKKMLFVFAMATSVTVLAQDPAAYLHMQFENNLEASTTVAGGVVFEAGTESVPYGTGCLFCLSYWNQEDNIHDKFNWESERQD